MGKPLCNVLLLLPVLFLTVSSALKISAKFVVKDIFSMELDHVLVSQMDAHPQFNSV